MTQQTAKQERETLAGRFSLPARPVAWQGRAVLQEVLDRRSPSQRYRDRDLLARLVAAAQSSPTARVALAWAQRHDVRFVIDDVTSARGYYALGTGVVGLNLSAIKDGSRAAAVGTLVHEIRHAWQDVHGLAYMPSPDPGSLSRSPLLRDLVIQAFFEADAAAHGRLAKEECFGWRGNIPAGSFLAQAFTAWFRTKAFLYGRGLSAAYAGYLGLGEKVDKAYVYNVDVASTVAPPDFSRHEVRERLGRSFAGVNYMAEVDGDFLLRTALSPAAAATYFSATPQQVFLHETRAIQKVQAPFRVPVPARPLPDRRMKTP